MRKPIKCGNFRVLRDDPSKSDMHNREGLTIRMIWESVKDWRMWPLYALGLVHMGRSILLLLTLTWAKYYPQCLSFHLKLTSHFRSVILASQQYKQTFCRYRRLSAGCCCLYLWPSLVRPSTVALRPQLYSSCGLFPSWLRFTRLIVPLRNGYILRSLAWSRAIPTFIRSRSHGLQEIRTVFKQGVL